MLRQRHWEGCSPLPVFARTAPAFRWSSAWCCSMTKKVPWRDVRRSCGT
jgi:hypothetical protein